MLETHIYFYREAKSGKHILSRKQNTPALPQRHELALGSNLSTQAEPRSKLFRSILRINHGHSLFSSLGEVGGLGNFGTLFGVIFVAVALVDLVVGVGDRLFRAAMKFPGPRRCRRPRIEGISALVIDPIQVGDGVTLIGTFGTPPSAMSASFTPSSFQCSRRSRRRSSRPRDARFSAASKHSSAESPGCSMNRLSFTTSVVKDDVLAASIFFGLVQGEDEHAFQLVKSPAPRCSRSHVAIGHGGPPFLPGSQAAQPPARGLHHGAPLRRLVASPVVKQRHRTSFTTRRQRAARATASVRLRPLPQSKNEVRRGTSGDRARHFIVRRSTRFSIAIIPAVRGAENLMWETFHYKASANGRERRKRAHMLKGCGHIECHFRADVKRCCALCRARHRLGHDRYAVGFTPGTW